MTYLLTITDHPAERFHYTASLDGIMGWHRGVFQSRVKAQVVSQSLHKAVSQWSGKEEKAISAVIVADLDEKTLKTLRSWDVEAVEAPEYAEQVASPATSAQMSYLKILGYTGSRVISKAEASRQIDRLKGSTLTAADVDDFTGAEHTW